MRICLGDAWEVSCLRKKVILEVPAFAGMTVFIGVSDRRFPPPRE